MDFFFHPRLFFFIRDSFFYAACVKTAGSRTLKSRPKIESRQYAWQQQWQAKIEGFAIADAILVVGQTRQNLQ